MPASRIAYQNWIVEIGYDPRTSEAPGRDAWESRLISLDDASSADISSEDVETTRREGERIEHIRRAVADAVESLSPEEREFVVRFYYMGQSYRDISEKSGRAVHKLTALHHRAVKKLKARLTGLVRERFHVEASLPAGCPLCESPDRREIDRLIAGRDCTATWRPVLKALRERFGLKIASPQAVIGHMRYHRGDERFGSQREGVVYE